MLTPEQLQEGKKLLVTDNFGERHVCEIVVNRGDEHRWGYQLQLRIIGTDVILVVGRFEGPVRMIEAYEETDTC